MFYFFQKDSVFIQCVVRPANDGVGFEIAITEPDGPERIEHYPSSDMVHRRWLELQERFQQDGWWGPLGRD
jgi:hypothetical protein